MEGSSHLHVSRGLQRQLSCSYQKYCNGRSGMFRLCAVMLGIKLPVERQRILGLVLLKVPDSEVSRMKKLINSPDDVASETMEGLVAAFPQSVRSLEGVRAIVRRDAPIQGKVAVVTGGGSGHEPMWWCYVG